MSFFEHSIAPQKLSDRLKDYKLLLAGQLATLVNNLVIYQIFVHHPFNNWEAVFLISMGIISLSLNVIAYLLLAELTSSSLVKRLVIGLLSLGIMIGLFSGSTFGPDENVFIQRLLIVSSTLFASAAFCVLLYLMVYDIFREKHDILYRLWGSACIFLLIGVLFSTFYFIMSALFPADFGLTGFPDVHHFVKCYTFSFYTLSGIDQPFEEFGMVAKNISVVESIFSNLYIVLLVGRLLSK